MENQNFIQYDFKKDYGSAATYALEVEKWCHQARFWMAYQQMLVTQSLALQFSQQYYPAMNPMAQNSIPVQAHQRIAFGVNLPRIFRFAMTQRTPQTIIVQQYTIPSFFRRIAAEAIDSFILFFFKLFVVYLLVEMEIILLDQFDKLFSAKADFQTFLDISQGLFNIELLCKVLSAFLEAFCVSYGFMTYPPGYTPGKFFMKLKVVSCLDIQPVNGIPNRVSVTSLPNVSIQSSICRSLIKNVITVFLFPISTAFYLFNYNRAIYDLAAKTVVVNAY